MDILSIVLQLILSLSILVTLHELGHFLPAKWFKTKVEKFYLFFNPKFSLWKKQIGETEYGIGWIPFGGYVKIAGMIDESMDKEQMKEPVKDYEFRAKPAWQRLIIMIGGVTVNFILGILIFAGILWYFGTSYIATDQVKDGIYVEELGHELGLENGDKIISIDEIPFDKFEPGTITQEIVLNNPKNLIIERNGQRKELAIPSSMVETLTKYENKGKTLFSFAYPQEIKKVSEGSAAESMGLQKGDRIVGVNNEPTPYIQSFVKALEGKENEEVTFTVERNGQTISKTGSLGEDGVLGVQNMLPSDIFEISRERYSLTEALPAGWNMAWNFLTGQIKAFGKIFKNEIKATDSLGSIVSIATMFDSGWDWERFWRITGMLSILLGFFNLLPIPALDGGYVMFLLWEVLTGRKPSDKFMEIATTAGFILLIILMIFALGLDFSRFF